MSESFNQFLNEHDEAIDEMAAMNLKDFVVDFSELYDHDCDLAQLVLEKPDMLTENLASLVVAKLRYRTEIGEVDANEVRVVLRNLPLTVPLRRVGSEHNGKMIQVNGVVVKATSIMQKLMMAYWKCKKCGETILVQQKGSGQIKPSHCPSCDGRHLELDEDNSMYVNSQLITLQDIPEEQPPGTMPRNQIIQLNGHMVDTVRPGDRITLTGVVRLIPIRGNDRLFSSIIEAFHIESAKQKELVITAEDEGKIRELSQDPWVHRRILQSIAPSIFGLGHVKEAIMYLLFGGVTKELPDVRIRGDINVLLVGDPGTGKSQLLSYTAMIAPRGLLTNGKGSTAAGLTATVTKGDQSGSFVLEAGALVLGDRGVVCVDEMDKMEKNDREAIHLPMEQGIIPIAKGGIVTTLNARCSILAAANPALGRYNVYQNIAQNINLPVTILSRFDLIFILRDIPNAELDMKMAEHILNLHMSGEKGVEAPVENDLLRKYISYSKNLKPAISNDVFEELRNFYMKMRKSSASNDQDMAISITARQLESLVRIAEARARLHLREEVSIEDVEAAINLMKRSLEQVGIDVTTGEIDIDILYTGKPRSLQMQLQKVLGVVSDMERITGVVKDEDLFNTLMEDHGIGRAEAARLIGVLMRDGTIYIPRPGYYRKC